MSELVTSTDSHIKSPRLCIAIKAEVKALVSKYDKHVRDLNERIVLLRTALEASQAKLKEADDKLLKIFGDDETDVDPGTDDAVKAMFDEWKAWEPVTA